MISERVLSRVIRGVSQQVLRVHPASDASFPHPKAKGRYLLYAHVPFCESLCPYCSFNRVLFEEEKALRYFTNLRREMRLLYERGYRFESMYIGGGTPTVLVDELCRTIDEARALFPLREVSCETNPNHLIPATIDKLEGRVQRLSVGVQSFDDGLLRQMGRLEKYGSGRQIIERLGRAAPHFTSLNADMIFNFPAQTEEMLISDIECAVESGATQLTFYPLMAAPSVRKSLAETVGEVSYEREAAFYRIICELLTEGALAPFAFGDAWSFNRRRFSRRPDATVQEEPAAAAAMIDEYVVDYEEYPAIGSGGFGFVAGKLFTNTFSLKEYCSSVEADRLSVNGSITMGKRNQMRYFFMMQLFGLRLDKQRFKDKFGLSLEAALPVELAFMRAAGAFTTDTRKELTLSPVGRYLTVVMMREFFIGVNGLRDQARAALPEEERIAAVPPCRNDG